MGTWLPRRQRWKGREPASHRRPQSPERLRLLYDGDDFGGETTMRARVTRELIDEIRTLRAEVAELQR